MDDFAKYEQVHNKVRTSDEFVLDQFEFLTGSELLAKYHEPLVFLYEEIITTPSLVLLSGPSKKGKSWYILHIANELRKAGHRICYLSKEDNTRRLQSRYLTLGGIADDNIIFWAGLSNDKQLPKGKKAHIFLRAIKRKYDPKVIIIDTIAAIRDSNKKENYASAEEEFSALRKLSYELDIVIICVHHNRKATDMVVDVNDNVLAK